METKPTLAVNFQQMLSNAARSAGVLLALFGVFILGAQALHWLKEGVWLPSTPRMEPMFSDVIAWVDAGTWIGLKGILESALDLPTSGYLIVGGLIIFAVGENADSA